MRGVDFSEGSVDQSARYQKPEHLGLLLSAGDGVDDVDDVDDEGGDRR